MERGGIGLHYFSDQSYAPAGKHTSNSRSTAANTTSRIKCRLQSSDSDVTSAENKK
jgi:hypothetical protein